MLCEGSGILNSRYTLIRGPLYADENSQAWIAEGSKMIPYLIKIWPYQANGSSGTEEGNAPDHVQRALWDLELRNLYRVSSSPGATESLLVLRDAGVDREQACFVMVLEGPGYSRLTEAFQNRPQYPWLLNRDIKTRCEIWTALNKLAEGLQLLHTQQVLHRNVGLDTVFFDKSLGVESLRLGGFEWSMRLHLPAGKTPPPNWSSPPEFFGQRSFGYGPETDWYAFGMLAARCLLDLERYKNNQTQDRYLRVLRAVQTTKEISELERILILQLIAANPLDRLTRGYEIQTLIRDIISGLTRGADTRDDERRLVVVISPHHDWVYNQAMVCGFTPNPDNLHDSYNPQDMVQVMRLKEFLQADLKNSILYAVPDRNYYLLVGQQLILRLASYEDSRLGITSGWELAFCKGIDVLRGNDGGSQEVELPQGQVVVRTINDVRKDRNIRQNARSWEQYLPRIDTAAKLRADLVRFHDFIRCINQLDLLILDSQIFRYQIVSHQRDKEGLEKITIMESARPRGVVSFLKKEAGMIEHLQREVESNKKKCRYVALTAPDVDGFRLPEIPDYHFWKISDFDPENKLVFLERPSLWKGKTLPTASKEGNLRTYGMFGSVTLISRREKAIRKLGQHTYLLRSLAAPGQVYMDTGAFQLPVPPPPDKVDVAKRAAIEDILRVRPIYALQGPPGTGKTTLVAYLLRQILTDDPVAQVLITAQAHGAVDVLRNKVRHEAFGDIPEEEQPLSVRLGNVSADDAGSVEKVSITVLQTAKDTLENLPSRGPLQEEWLDAANEMILAIKATTSDRTTPDFCELVKRGANLTYCTTSAGELESLADMVQSFDWSIVEEAGKVHSFDLALPLQGGHRWLLIGDHKQLPPYRFEDYKDGITCLEDAIQSLEKLPYGGGGLVDWDWIRGWRDQDNNKKQDFKDYAQLWLNIFERIYNECARATGSESLTIEEANGSAAGILSGQHRMHPAIGELISQTYYKGKITNCTQTAEGQPFPRVVHPFTKPDGIKDKAIVWIDLPWARRCLEYHELGPKSGHPRYTNPKEVEALLWFFQQLNGTGLSIENPLDVAILSPYNLQVLKINRMFSTHPLSKPWLWFKPRLHAPLVADAAEDARERFAHTVDSFQGNQAGIIAISLVRNNDELPGQGMGFLEKAPRMNVLLSRAEKLLVLVGSMEFFHYQVSLVNIADRAETLWHWKKVMTTVEDWTNSGKALKIEFPRS